MGMLWVTGQRAVNLTNTMTGLYCSCLYCTYLISTIINCREKLKNNFLFYITKSVYFLHNSSKTFLIFKACLILN